MFPKHSISFGFKIYFIILLYCMLSFRSPYLFCFLQVFLPSFSMLAQGKDTPNHLQHIIYTQSNPSSSSSSSSSSLASSSIFENCTEFTNENDCHYESKTCFWTGEECISPDNFTSCSQITEFSRCRSTYQESSLSCIWNGLRCVNSTDNDTCSDFLEMNKCMVSGHDCGWCQAFDTEICMPKVLYNIICPECYSYKSKSQCHAHNKWCKWCDNLGVCQFSKLDCEDCEQLNSTSCDQSYFIPYLYYYY